MRTMAPGTKEYPATVPLARGIHGLGVGRKTLVETLRMVRLSSWYRLM